jgi:hypothetical protein
MLKILLLFLIVDYKMAMDKKCYDMMGNPAKKGFYFDMKQRKFIRLIEEQSSISLRGMNSWVADSDIKDGTDSYDKVYTKEEIKGCVPIDDSDIDEVLKKSKSNIKWFEEIVSQLGDLEDKAGTQENSS